MNASQTATQWLLFAAYAGPLFTGMAWFAWSEKRDARAFDQERRDELAERRARANATR